MGLRQLAIVQAKSEQAKINLATYMGGSTFVYIENKREDGRIFVSSEYNRKLIETACKYFPTASK